MLRSSVISVLAMLIAAFVVGCSSCSSSTAGADDYNGDGDVEGDAGAPTSCESQSDGTPCDDDNACTQTDTCQSGVCVGGAGVHVGGIGTVGVSKPPPGSGVSVGVVKGGGSVGKGDGDPAGVAVFVGVGVTEDRLQFWHTRA